jgi:hypothetical protein
VDRLDFVFVHDPAQDFHGDGWLAQLETARTGAFRALTRLRDEGVITGWGLGVNLTEPVEFTLGLTDAQPDGTLLAGRYTLLDHEHALQRLMPTAAAHGVDIVIGGPYNSGILAGGTRFEYQNAPAEITAKVARIDTYLVTTGVAATVVRPTTFTDFIVKLAAKFVPSGAWGGHAGAGRVALIDTRDVATVFAVILTDAPSTMPARCMTSPGPPP